MNRIYLTGPWITEAEVDKVSNAVRDGWYQSRDDYQQKFQDAFCKYMNIPYAMALPSFISGMHLAMLATKIKPGDEILVPEICDPAYVFPILNYGAVPVFVDIDPDTWCINIDSIKKWTTPKTRAVLVSEIFGAMPDWDEILPFTQRRNLTVIEDSSHAIASEYKGRLAGSFGDISLFCFSSDKFFTTGEGGMLTSNDEEMFKKVLSFVRHNGNGSSSIPVEYPCQMSILQAALGLAQLERINDLKAKKQDIFFWYEHEFSGVEGVSLNFEAPAVQNTFHLVTLIVDPALGLTRKEIMTKLKENQIDVGEFFSPLSSLEQFAHLKQTRAAREENTVSYQISPNGIHLPSALNMTEEDVVKVCDALKTILFS